MSFDFDPPLSDEEKMLLLGLVIVVFALGYLVGKALLK